MEKITFLKQGKIAIVQKVCTWNGQRIQITWNKKEAILFCVKDGVAHFDGIGNTLQDENGKRITGMRIEKVIEKEIQKLQNEIEEEERKEQEREEEKDRNILPIGFRHIFGCDCADTIEFLYKEAGSFRGELDRALLQFYRTQDCENMEKEEMEAGSYSYGGFSLMRKDAIRLREILESRQKIEVAKKEEKKNKEKKRVQKLFEIAQKTGVKQEIRRYLVPTEDVDSNIEDSSWTDVIIYATPDGKTKEEYSHHY